MIAMSSKETNGYLNKDFQQNDIIESNVATPSPFTKSGTEFSACCYIIIIILKLQTNSRVTWNWKSLSNC